MAWRGAISLSSSILCTGGPAEIRKEAWSFYRTISGLKKLKNAGLKNAGLIDRDADALACIESLDAGKPFSWANEGCSHLRLLS